VSDVGVPTAETVRFPVTGMTCVACVGRITRAIRRLDGVAMVRVDLRTETATVRREPALVSNAALAAAIAGAGYRADLEAPVAVAWRAERSFLDRLLRRWS
jgi:P-type Cu+ transporter